MKSSASIFYIEVNWYVVKYIWEKYLKNGKNPEF